MIFQIPPLRPLALFRPENVARALLVDSEQKQGVRRKKNAAAQVNRELRCKISVLKPVAYWRHDTDAGGWRDLDNINVEETMQRVAELIAAEKGISPALKDNCTANETYSAPASSICVHCICVPLGAAHAVALQR